MPHLFGLPRGNVQLTAVDDIFTTSSSRYQFELAGFNEPTVALLHAIYKVVTARRSLAADRLHNLKQVPLMEWVIRQRKSLHNAEHCIETRNVE